MKPSQAQGPLTPKDGKGFWFILLIFEMLWLVLWKVWATLLSLPQVG